MGLKLCTSEIALRIGVLTGIPAKQWLTLQVNYDEHKANQCVDFMEYRRTAEAWRHIIQNELENGSRKRFRKIFITPS